MTEPVSRLYAAAPEALWQEMLAELRPQMSASTFHNWLGGSHLLSRASTPGFWVVVVRNEYAWEWLTCRLYPVVGRTVAWVVGQEVMVCFVPRLLRPVERRPLSRPPGNLFDDEPDSPKRRPNDE
jgi:hypothetical protein